MLPAFLTTSKPAPALFAPFGFRAAAPPVRRVAIEPREYLRPRGATDAQRAGLRYEEKVQERLSKWFSHYLSSPRIAFKDASGTRICIPDGVLLYPDRTVVFEIKIRHMPEAWFQLVQLYGPVLCAYSAAPVQLVEIVNSFDPAVVWPGEFDRIDCLESALNEPLGKPGVFEWKL